MISCENSTADGLIDAEHSYKNTNRPEVRLSASETSAFTAAYKPADSPAEFILSLAEGLQKHILAQARARSKKDAAVFAVFILRRRA